MKICITSTGKDLESQVDPRFGRCAYFLIIETDTMKYEAIANPNMDAVGGAGIKSAQLVADKGVAAVRTGEVGPNASQALSSAGIKVKTGISGKVKDNI